MSVKLTDCRIANSIICAKYVGTYLAQQVNSIHTNYTELQFNTNTVCQ